MEQSVDQLSRKIESMKIDAHRKTCEVLEVPLSKDVSAKLDRQMHPSPTSESLDSNGSVSPSETTGDAASSYGSRDEYPELTLVATPNGFIPPHGTFYSGSPAPVMNMQGYMPYAMEGVPYASPVMEYNFVNQSYGGSFSSGVQYPAHGNNGYLYGPQVYQYPPPPYYQQAPGGQYLSAPPALPAGGVMLLDSQDPGRPGVVMSSGYTSVNPYAGSIPTFPITMVQPNVPLENGAIPVAVTYTPSHTLRASAPAWVEPSAKTKGLQKQCISNGAPPPGVSQSSAPANPVQPSKSSGVNSTAANGILSKSSPSQVAGITAAVTDISEATATAVPAKGTNMKANGAVEDGSNQPVKGIGSVNNQNVLTVPVYEPTKDAWVSKVKGQQLTPACALACGPTPSSAPAPALRSLKAPVGTDKDLGTRLPNGEHFNSADFVTKYDNAKHFIIKSYSEDNVHKSVQYSVWASTPNGNKKLDEAFQDALRHAGGKPRGCPVFLYFSVNGSRQFCGVAEMTGPVDYTRTMEFWEQHKWSGSFPVKWHIIKDVPNSQLRRIILENNENKPVTNSRDTQEVNLQQGLEMLGIFKSYPARTSILDEFPMYPTQKLVQDVKPRPWSLQCFPKIGEQIAKRDEADGLKAAKLNSTSISKIADGPKPKEVNSQERNDTKAVYGKGFEISAQDVRAEKEKLKVEKENIKVSSKEERI